MYSIGKRIKTYSPNGPENASNSNIISCSGGEVNTLTMVVVQLTTAGMYLLGIVYNNAHGITVWPKSQQCKNHSTERFEQIQNIICVS